MSGVRGASGGRRPGAGRKPKTAFEKAVTGNPGHRGNVIAHPSSDQVQVPAPIETFEPPDDLPLDERQIWRDLAPHAFKARTLTKGTALSFRLLCQNVALVRSIAVGAEKGGANHRGMLQRVDAELLRFNLSPCGKAMYGTSQPAVPVNPLEKFLKRG